MLDAIGVDFVVRIDAGNAAGAVFPELVVGFRAIERLVGQGGQADIVSGAGKTPQVAVVSADQAVIAGRWAVRRRAAAAGSPRNGPRPGPHSGRDPRQRRQKDVAQGLACGWWHTRSGSARAALFRGGAAPAKGRPVRRSERPADSTRPRARPAAANRRGPAPPRGDIPPASPAAEPRGAATALAVRRQFEQVVVEVVDRRRAAGADGGQQRRMPRRGIAAEDDHVGPIDVVTAGLRFQHDPRGDSPRAMQVHQGLDDGDHRRGNEAQKHGQNSGRVSIIFRRL